MPAPLPLPEPLDPGHPPRRFPGLAGALAVTMLTAVALWNIIGMGVPARTSATQDQDEFHLLAIQGFAAQWPEWDLIDYRSATTPGYHLAVAAVARFITDDLRALRLAGSLFTLGLVLTLALAVGTRAGPSATAALCLPVVCSSYTVASGGWLLPDNAGWWGVTGVLVAAWAYRPHWRWYFGVAAMLAALVLVRQIHIWTAGVLWLAAWMGPAGTKEGREIWAWVWGPDLRCRIGRTLMTLLATLPAAAILAYFAAIWGGLVPPVFKGGGLDPVTGIVNPRNEGGNPAAPATVLAILGALGPFYLAYYWPVVRRALRGGRSELAWIGLGAAAALIAAAIPRTDWNLEQGRYSGVWNLVRATPTVLDRSPILIAMAVVGGAVLGALLKRLEGRDRWLFAGTMAAFIAAHAASAHAWQRYYEPFLLIVLALAATRVRMPAPDAPDHAGAHRAPAGPMFLIGPLALAGLLVVATVVRL
jgi:hypothetical protein